MMKEMKAEIEACMQEHLAADLDAVLVATGFSRREKGMRYRRQHADSIQAIDMLIEIHPADRPDASAAIYPWLEVTIGDVEELVRKMIGDDALLLAELTDTTLRQPIEFTSAKASHARWFVYQQDSMPVLVREIRLFIVRWVLPFLDLYSTPEGICSLYDSGDERVINDSAQRLRAAAAMVLCGRAADAIRVMDRWFGKAGPRKRYSVVFEYLQKLA